MSSSTTDIEKENLEAHVELCAERYKQLETKIVDLDKRMGVVETYLVEIKDSIAEKSGDGNKTLIAIGTSVLVAMFGAIITLLLHIASK